MPSHLFKAMKIPRPGPLCSALFTTGKFLPVTQRSSTWDALQFLNFHNDRKLCWELGRTSKTAELLKMKADSQKKIQFYIRVQIVFFDTEGSHSVASRKETILSYFVVPDKQVVISSQCVDACFWSDNPPFPLLHISTFIKTFIRTEGPQLQMASGHPRANVR